MTKLEHLWSALEDVTDLLAIPAMWREACGTDFGLIEASLHPTSKRSGIYPCPFSNGYMCPRRIVNYNHDEIAAICQDPHKICPDLSLNGSDVVLHSLDLLGFVRPILEVAGIRNPQMEPRAPGVWNIGLAVSGDLTLQPAYLLVFGGKEEFATAAQSLMFDIEGPFTILAPTDRHWTGTLRERLRSPRISFVSLDERVAVDDAGRFVAVRWTRAADVLTPTPRTRREDLIEQFRRNNGNCTIKLLCYWANVSREDFNKWKNSSVKKADGRLAIPDTSKKAKRIEKLLQLGIRSRD
jgi:hypothetical protein